MIPESISNGSINPRFAAFALRVGRSRIEGRGVYAAETIPPRRKVIEYCGERISLRKAVARIKKVCGPGGSKYLSIFYLNRYWLIDGAVGGSGAELINHSCDPNLKARVAGERILFFSLRRIRKDEELTLDYKLPSKACRLRCRCGSPNCRGTVNKK